MSTTTERLRLVPATAALARAELGPPHVFAQLLGATVPENWPPELVADVLQHFADELQADPWRAGWLSWYWILRGKAVEKSVLIGSGGFKGRPQPDGTVEVGYSVLPQYQRRGYATEALGALVSWAFAHGGVARVVADALVENRASIRALEKSGFRRVGRGPEAGTERSELVRAAEVDDCDPAQAVVRTRRGTRQ